MSRIGVVIPSWNTRELLRACLLALRASTGVELQVVVVEDGSSDGSADMLQREFPKVRLVRLEENRGFTHACNRGLRELDTPLVLLLNADTEVESAAIATLARFLEAAPRDYAGAAPRLTHPDGSTQRACMAFPTLRTALHFGTPLGRARPHSRELERYHCRDFDHEHDADVEQPPAACLLLRRAALEALTPPGAPGPLDESMALYFSDVDLARRLARAGQRIRFVSAARVLHRTGSSTAQRPDRLLAWHCDRLAYYRKHHGRLAGLWLKLVVTWTAADHMGTQTAFKLRRLPHEPLEPLLRDLWRFLWR